MTKTTTNLLGIAIAILAGTYFFVMYCSECGASSKEVVATETVALKDDLPQAEAVSQSEKEKSDHGQAPSGLQ